MPTLQYDEFVLEIRHDNELEARLTTGGDRKIEKGKVELERKSKAILNYLVRRLRNGDLEDEGLGILGDVLYDALFPSAIRGLFQDAVDSVRRDKNDNRRLRVCISVDQRSEVVSWPLEFLRSAETDFLATNSKLVTLSRRIEFEHSRHEPEREEPPLKVLVVISRPTGFGGVMSKAVEDITKWAATESPPDAPGQPRINIKLLGLTEDFESSSSIELINKPSTYQNFQEIVSDWAPHIIHFMGHGRVDEGEACGQLALIADSGEEDWCSADDFQKLFSRRCPSLVVLQACESAMPATGSGFMSLAAHLVRRNVPAVVAMQFEIRNDCATDFATGFYRALADGMEIDAAVQRGRFNITMQGSRRWKARHFGTPVLFMLSPHGIVLPVSTEPARQQQVGSSSMARARSVEELKSSLAFALEQGRKDVAEAFLRELDEALRKGKMPVGGDLGGLCREGIDFISKNSDNKRLV